MSGVQSEPCYQVCNSPLKQKRNPTQLLQREVPWQLGAPEKGRFYWNGFKPTSLSQKSSVIKAEQCAGQLECSFLYNCTGMLIFLEVNLLQEALREWAGAEHGPESRGQVATTAGQGQ